MTTWRIKGVNIKQTINEYQNTKDISTFCVDISISLKTMRPFITTPAAEHLNEILFQFEHEVKSEEDANHTLINLYDWGDDHRIWLGP